MQKSSQEIRELVDNLHPRSPKEVMGEAASSSLVGSTMTAAASTFVLLLSVTLIVFLIGGTPEKKTEAAAAAPTPTIDAAKTQSAAPTGTTMAADKTAGENENVDPENAVEAMGIGETKEADSEPETLENRLEQLLDGLE